MLEEVLFSLDVWLNTTGIIQNKFCFVTVGNADLQTFLRDECQSKGIEYQDYLKHYVNLIPKFRKTLKTDRNYGLKKMIDLLDLQFIGQQHSGIDDAYNTARIVQ